MSIADRCVERFKQAKEAGQHLTLAQVHAIISEEERNQISALETRSRTRESPKTRTLSGQTDEEWISYLETLPHLQGVDVKREIGKCQFWCSVNGKEPTRRRITNWLNKAERTVTFNGQGQSSLRPQLEGVADMGRTIAEPQGWSERVKPSEDLAWASGRTWESLNSHYKQAIAKLCQTP